MGHVDRLFNIRIFLSGYRAVLAFCKHLPVCCGRDGAEETSSMEDIRDEVVVRASAEQVWQAIADPVAHAEWHPFLTHIAGEHALGSTRTCDVLVGKKPGKTEERCSTYVQGRQIMWSIDQDSTGFSRMVSGWSAGFSLEPQDSNATRVVAASTFTPTKFFSRLMIPMIRRKFHRTQRSILSALKQYVER
jgi:uncharacterized protein YndB with AHSA1/START domain